MVKERIVTVDFARGLLAIGVLFYHTLIYEGMIALPQIGRHGVYAFFVISGFALYVNYRDKLGGPDQFRQYLVARFWRIAPLYYTAALLSTLVYGGDSFSWTKVFFNASFLFGFANPGETSMTVGGWSIGIEIAFYLVFPVVVAACAGNVLRLATLTIVLLMGQILYAHHVLAGTTLVDAWVSYIQPVAFAGYFLGGCLLGEIYRRRSNWKGQWVAWPVCAIALMLFVIAPRDSEAILLGPLGILLTLATLVLVSGVAFLPEPQGYFREVAEWVGRLSYPIYLLHPLVYHYASKIPLAESHIPVTLLLTIALSELVNRLIERPAIRFSRTLSVFAKP